MRRGNVENKGWGVLCAALAAVVATAALVSGAAAQQTRVFTYYGDVSFAGGTPAPAGTIVTIRNLTQNDSLSATVGLIQTGKYEATRIEYGGGNAAAAGDVVQLVVRDGDGTPLSDIVETVLTATNISSARLRTDFVVGTPAVVVVGPVAVPVDPGNQAILGFEVYNVGDITDSYSISVTGSHPEWLSYPAVTGPVGPAGMTIVPVTLTVPPGVEWTVYETVGLEACSQIDPSVCGYGQTQVLVAVAVTSSSVRAGADRIEVRWTVSEDAAGLPVRLFRRQLPGLDYASIADPEVAVSGRTSVFQDRDVAPGETYDYMLQIVGGETFVFPLGRATVPPRAFRLEQNYPNPFNPATRIRFELDRPAVVDLRIYDVAGRPVKTLVAHRRLGATAHTLEWDGTDDAGATVTSGVYFYRLVANGRVLTRRMVMLK